MSRSRLPRLAPQRALHRMRCAGVTLAQRAVGHLSCVRAAVGAGCRALRAPGVGVTPRALLLALVAVAALPTAAAAAPAASQPATATSSPAVAQTPPWVSVRALDRAAAATHEGSVEAVRQTVVASQVSGALTAIEVVAGQRVAAGQVLARIDARSAQQGAQASQAQLAAAQAQLAVAAADLQRKRQLHAQQFISGAALDEAEALHRAALAQVRAARAQSGVADTQTGLHVLRAPYAGVIAALQSTQGEMALPGRPLMTLYDPAAMRVVAAVPSSALAPGGAPPSLGDVRIEVPALGAAGSAIAPTRVERLPTVDPQSLTQLVRADLPVALSAALAPGQFARLHLKPPSRAQASGASGAAGAPGAAQASSLVVPYSAIVRRSELTAVYVLDTEGRPQLRQVRLGPRVGADAVEVLSGLSEGERVLTQPASALRR